MQLEVDLLKYAPIQSWKPSIGDVIHKDGLFFRSCFIVIGVNGDKVSVRKSGNIHLLISGDYKDVVFDGSFIRSIKNSSVGSYFIVSNGIYYV